jgi:putative ABC transport system ATP-binding protein
MPSPRPFIELAGVSCRRHVGDATVAALDGIDLRVAGGELTVVLGPPGAGKTTLLHLVSALEAPTAGRVVVAGHDVGQAPHRQLFRFRRETVAYVFETFNLFPGLTALENVEFAIAIANQGEREGGRDAAETLRRVGLRGSLDRFPFQLSSREQQRVAIARAVATGNPVLLADEPTRKLDFRAAVRIFKLLREQARGGRCVLVATSQPEIALMADRVVELLGGRVVADGPPFDRQLASDW